MSGSTEETASSQMYYVQIQPGQALISKQLAWEIQNFVKEYGSQNILGFDGLLNRSLIYRLWSVLGTMLPNVSLDMEKRNGALILQELRVLGEAYTVGKLPPVEERGLCLRFTQEPQPDSPSGNDGASQTGSVSKKSAKKATPQ